MKIGQIEIDQYKFYQIGLFCFGVIAIMNTATFFQNYGSYLYLTALISAVASIVFNYLIFGFFFYLYRQLPPKNTKIASDSEMKEMLKGGENDRI